MSDNTGAPAAAESPWRQVVGVVLALATLLVTLLVAFGLPALESAPHEVPVAVVGPEAVITQLETTLDAASPDAFELIPAEDAAASEEMIRDREVYGAFVVTEAGMTIQTASAASSMVASTLSTMGQQLAAASGSVVEVVDVVPFTEDDPRGIGLTAGALPIALGGFIAAVGSIFLIKGDRQRLVTATSFAIVGGLGMTAVLEFGFGTFDGNYWATSAAAILGIAATSFLVLGLERLLGRAGIGLGALLVVLLGNPLSGLSSAPEFLPTPWGTIGQLLPPGATGTLLRNVAFFDGAAITQPLLVLLGYVVLGLGMFALGSLRSRTSTNTSTSTSTQSAAPSSADPARVSAS